MTDAHLSPWNEQHANWLANYATCFVDDGRFSRRMLEIVEYLRTAVPAQGVQERIAELQYAAGMYQSLYELAIKDCQAWRKSVVRLRDLAIDHKASAIEERCFDVLMERPLYPPPSTDSKCAKCGCETKGEAALVDGEIWCHPCADGAAPLSSPESQPQD